MVEQKHLGVDFPKHQARKNKAYNETFVEQNPNGGRGFNVRNSQGVLNAFDDGDGYQVAISQNRKESRGQGYGLALYHKLIDEAIANGKQFIRSDSGLSQWSYGIYKKLQQEGYNVKENPNKEHIAGKEKAYTAKGNEPIFEIDLSKTPRRRLVKVIQYGLPLKV